MARADVIVTAMNNSAVHWNGGGVQYIVQKNGATDTFYVFYVDSGVDLFYIKSTDGGFTWGAPVVVRTGTLVAHSVFYSRWSGVASDIVHIAYTDANTIFYRSLDISSDTLGTEQTVFSGVSSASNGALTIWRSRGTNTIRVAGSIDAGAEDGAWSSTDSGATWTDTIADPSEGAASDQYFGLPGWNEDANDEMLIFWDASANGISVKRYDDSGNAWAETAIIADGSAADVTPGNQFPHLACFVDVANSRNIVVAWTAIDTANADLRCFIITDGAVTETSANVVLNSVDDQGFCAAGIDTATGTWYVFYGGASDGSEAYFTGLKIYYKTSTDAGATWSSETALTAYARSTSWMACTPRFDTKYLVGLHSDLVQDELIVSVLIPSAAASGGQGWWGG